MGFFIDGFQLFNGIMRVYLGCCKAAVTEELFDCIEIGAIIWKMGGKAMAEHVRTLLIERLYLAA